MIVDVWLGEFHEWNSANDRFLSEEELARADSSTSSDECRRFKVGALLLRLVVAVNSGEDPSRVVVKRSCPTCGGAHGKPRVAGSALNISLSHSRPFIALASSADSAVGVDIEQPPIPHFRQISHRVCNASEPVETAFDFLTYWCRKEAAVKATGDGIGIGLRRVVVSPSRADAEVLAYPGGNRIALKDLSTDGELFGAVAVLDASDFQLRMRNANRLLHNCH